MTDSEILSSINQRLELITFLEVSGGTFQLVGDCAPWLLRFCPALASDRQLVLKDTFEFLDSFIAQSKEHFQTTGAGSLGSGPWSERDMDGVEQNLSATALLLDDRLAIQMRHVPSEQLYHRRIFQRAREYSLEYERMQNEKDQKEVLMFAVIHDLSGPLTSISGVIEVLSSMDLPEAERTRLFRMALSQIKSTHELIHSILKVFDEQDHRFDPRSLDAQTAPALTEVMESVVANFNPAFDHQGVSLKLENSLQKGEDKVVAEGEQLARVVSNLLENALRYSPAKSEVVLSVEPDQKQIKVKFTDQGDGVPDELVAGLFQRFVGGRKYGGKAGFGLYYCQMCINKWGGQIDYFPVASSDDANGDVQEDGDKLTQEKIKGSCFQIILHRFED